MTPNLQAISNLLKSNDLECNKLGLTYIENFISNLKYNIEDHWECNKYQIILSYLTSVQKSIKGDCNNILFTAYNGEVTSLILNIILLENYQKSHNVTYETNH